MLDKPGIVCLLCVVALKKKRVRVRPIHNLIKRLRQANGLSQQELANHCGLDKSSIGHWEREMSAPKLRNLEQLSKIFSISVVDLLKAMQ